MKSWIRLATTIMLVVMLNLLRAFVLLELVNIILSFFMFLLISYSFHEVKNHKKEIEEKARMGLSSL